MTLFHDMMLMNNANFPIILSSATSVTNNTQTTHAITLPSGIQVGELLIAVLGNNGNRTHTWPAGWTEIADSLNGTASAATIAYKVADGTEGASVTVTGSTGSLTAHCSVRIGGNWKTPAISSVTTGTSTAPDSGSVTSSTIASNYLFMSVAAGRLNATLTGVTPPTNYVTEVNSNLTTLAFAIIADRLSTTNSDDPAAWSLTTGLNPNWLAWTIVV